MATDNKTEAYAEAILPQKMEILIKELQDSSMRLQRAVIRREGDLIEELLSMQKEKVAAFESCKAEWHQIMAASANNNFEKINDELETEIKKLQEINKNTEALIKIFLSSVRNALKRIDSGASGETLFYGDKGKTKNKKIFNNISKLV